MKTVTCLGALVLVESAMILMLWRANQTQRESLANLDHVRSDLALTIEANRSHEDEVQVLNGKVAQLEQEVAQTKLAAPSETSTPAEKSPPKEELPPPLPLGLTTNDVVLESLLVTGNDTVGILSVPLTGWALERLKEYQRRRYPLVFGKLISVGDYGTWMHQGTNFGFGLKFSSRGEAEALAAELRALGGN
jgi:hypothetical protein